MSVYQDKILYGKNPLERIVSIEVNGSIAEIFVLKDDLSVESVIVPNKYWFLSTDKINRHAKRLIGDLDYKWGYQFDDLDEFVKFRKIYQNEDIFCLGNYKEALQIKDGYTYFKGLNPKDVPILSFDIETTGLKRNSKLKLLLISNTFRKGDKIVKKLFAYDDYPSEKEFIEDWCKWVREMDPSVICGHNIVSFDLPTLAYIADRSGTELLLGRDDSPIMFHEKESKFRVDGTRDLHYKKCFIYGREIIDTMFLAYKADFSKKYESYGLKQIIKQEGLEKKDRQFYDANLIRFNYENKDEWQKIKNYCIDDSDDALALYDLFIPPFFYLTQMIPKPFQLIIESASGSQLNALMCRAYLQDKHSLPKATPTKKYEGAISWGNPGIHRNCMKVDVTSLYPSIMLEYQIYDKNKDVNKYLPYLVTKLRERRLEHKKLFKETGDEKYDHLQNMEKILINSMYGFLGASGLNFNSPDCAEAVTKYGREILQKSIVWATGSELVYSNSEEDEDELDEDA